MRFTFHNLAVSSWSAIGTNWSAKWSAEVKHCSGNYRGRWAPDSGIRERYAFKLRGVGLLVLASMAAASASGSTSNNNGANQSTVSLSPVMMVRIFLPLLAVRVLRRAPRRSSSLPRSLRMPLNRYLHLHLVPERPHLSLTKSQA